MIRGCQRRIYYVKNPGNGIFEEAYFVIRRNYTGRGVTLTGDGEFAGEAARIFTEAAPAARKRKSRLFAFFAGVAASAVTAAAVALIVLR